MSVPNDDDPQDFKQLAEACLLDMERYATDETPHRMMVSVRAYRARFNLIEELTKCEHPRPVTIRDFNLCYECGKVVEREYFNKDEKL